jgi:hypothetical protein
MTTLIVRVKENEISRRCECQLFSVSPPSLVQGLFWRAPSFQATIGGNPHLHQECEIRSLHPKVFFTTLTLMVTAALLATTAFGEARAESALPASAQGRILEALSPLKPGGVVVAPWSIGNIQLEKSQIRIDLQKEKTTSSLVLSQREKAPQATRQTPSFSIMLAADAPQDQAFIRSVERIRSQIARSDKGDYFIEFEERQNETRQTPGADLDISWVLAGLLLLAFLLVASKPTRTTLKIDLPIALALMAVAYALRQSLGPMTFLHENAHGVHLLEQIAGLSFVERPMAGQIALGRFFAFFGSPTIESLTAGVALVASAQAALVYFLCRALQCQRPAAAVAAMLVATLPLLVRMTASEGAFGPATTFLLCGAIFAVEATRQSSGRHLMGALVFVAVAGHFRPVMYTAAAPIALSVLILSSREERQRWIRRPAFYLAGVLFLLCTLDDMAGLLQRLGEGSPMTPGWWQGLSLHSWPLVDPHSTPAWFLPLVLIGGALAWKSGRKRELLWLSLLGTWLTFVYTSDNAWPASLRYAVAYAWLGPVAIGLGLNSLSDRMVTTKARFCLACVGLMALSAPLTHLGFISHRFAQQEEIDFQENDVIPLLLQEKGAKIITPWPELAHMSGTLHTVPLRLQGLEIVHHTQVESTRFDRRVYWYRGLACWAKRDSDTGDDTSRMREVCRSIESAHPWKPVVSRTLTASSEADWIQLGDGRSPVEVVLFVRGAIEP